MLNKLNISELEEKKIEDISSEVYEIYERYKNRIEEIIYNNYWLEEEEKLLLLFKELWIVLSDRNKELLDFIEKKYSLNFKKDFDFSWWIKLQLDILDDNVPEKIKSFFSAWYTRQEWKNIHSRGYWYYFNFDWLENKGNNFNLDIQKYLEWFSKYYMDVMWYLWEFNSRKISELNDNEKKILLVWLEHYKNILLFLQNFIISISDKDYLAKHVLNISPNIFKKYFNDVSNEWDFIKLNTWITKELESLIIDFSDITLWIDSDNEVSYNIHENMDKIFGIFGDLFEWSFEKQSNDMENLKNKEKKWWKKTDIAWVRKSINRLNNKLIGKLIRIIREEDNPIKELFSCHNIACNTPKDTNSIDITGVLYWGIEMPYMMKYIYTRFLHKNPNDINIELLWLSMYSNRNLKQTSSIWNYKPLEWEENSKWSRLQVVLDDNSFYWTSLQVASNIWSSKWPIHSWVAEIWLRRGNVWKLYEWSNISHLLSKVSTSSSVTPIEKNKWTYRNMVNKYILKKMPWLVWKL